MHSRHYHRYNQAFCHRRETARYTPRGHTACILVTTIITIRLFVTEERLRDTLPVTTLELSISTHGLLGVEIWLYQAGLGQTVTVVNLSFPVTSLPLKIKRKTRWAFNR